MAKLVKRRLKKPVRNNLNRKVNVAWVLDVSQSRRSGVKRGFSSQCGVRVEKCVLPPFPVSVRATPLLPLRGHSPAFSTLHLLAFNPVGHHCLLETPFFSWSLALLPFCLSCLPAFQGPLCLPCLPSVVWPFSVLSPEFSAPELPSGGHACCKGC